METRGLRRRAQVARAALPASYVARVEATRDVIQELHDATALVAEFKARTNIHFTTVDTKHDLVSHHGMTEREANTYILETVYATIRAKIPGWTVDNLDDATRALMQQLSPEFFARAAADATA